MADHKAQLIESFDKGNTFTLWHRLSKILEDHPDTKLPEEIDNELSLRDAHIKQDNLALFQFINPDIEKFSQNGLDRSLYVAVRSGSFNMTRYLIEHGADILGMYNQTRFAPHLAVVTGSIVFFDYVCMLYSEALGWTLKQVLKQESLKFGNVETYARDLGLNRLADHIANSLKE